MDKVKILVVEDDFPIRNLICTTLETQGYQYIAARTGEEAVGKAAAGQPDVMLLDLGLPDMEGVEIIKRVRTWSSMPIIVISARSEDSDKVEALDAGADEPSLSASMSFWPVCGWRCGVSIQCGNIRRRRTAIM